MSASQRKRGNLARAAQGMLRAQILAPTLAALSTVQSREYVAQYRFLGWSQDSRQT